MGKTLRQSMVAGLVALGLCAAGGARAATTEIFLLDIDHCSGGCLPNVQDNVTVTENGSALDFVVTLFGGDAFKSTTSGQHEALAFNIGKSTISLTNLAGPDFSLVSSNQGSHQQDGLGNFNYLISSSETGATTTSFEIANVGFSDLTANSLGNFFQIDLFSGANGNSGSVGSNGFTPVAGQAGSVPEASTWAMMLAGFVGLGYAAFRRSRRSSVSVISE